MAGDASAYAALGVEPGCDATTIEQAYKRLIKQHHPDRPGGDARRAAQINLAYRELRRSRPLRDPLELNEPLMLRRSGGRGAIFLSLSMLSLVGALLLVTGPGESLARKAAPSLFTGLPHGQPAPTVVSVEPMDQGLHMRAIDGAIRDAVAIASRKKEAMLAAASQACHGELRAEPSIQQLDRCAAFDDAVVQIRDRDPLRDQGPFSDLTVTRRQWAAASQLSGDYVAIDSRLSRISLQVELALAPAEPVVPAAAAPPARD